MNIFLEQSQRYWGDPSLPFGYSTFYWLEAISVCRALVLIGRFGFQTKQEHDVPSVLFTQTTDTPS